VQWGRDPSWCRDIEAGLGTLRFLHRAVFDSLGGWHGPDGLGGFLRMRSSDVDYVDVDDRFVLRDIDSKVDLEQILLDRKCT